MADILIAALAADCLIACALTAWAVSDLRPEHRPQHLRSTR